MQSKETILTEYDFSKEFSKRKLQNNWSKYEEMSTEEENEQMTAADFGAMLSAPKSIGTHFTLNSEKHWLESNENDENPAAAGTIFAKRFQLNLATLKNGVGRLPFYVRNRCPKDLFTQDEIVDMDCRVSYMEAKENAVPLDSRNQNILDILRDSGEKQPRANKNSEPQKRERAQKTSGRTENQTLKSEPDILESLFSDLDLDANESKHRTISDKEKQPSTSNDSDNIDRSSQGTRTAGSAVGKSPSSPIKANKQGDIQDWLDDILNEG